MADPTGKPIKWSKNFQVYVEKHNLYDMFQELLKQIILKKPEDPLEFIRTKFPRLSKHLYNPQAFVVGSNVAQSIAKRVASGVGAKYLGLEEIIQSAQGSVKGQLGVFSNGDNGDEAARKTLVEVVHKRLSADDCETNGYVLYGFPQSKAQAQLAQQVGVLPRHVFVFLPESTGEDEIEEGDDASVKPDAAKQSDYSTMKDIASSYHYEICKVITYEKLMRTKRNELESEVQGVLMTGKASNAPFVPRISLMGPPASGKSEIAEVLAEKFSIVNVDWIELVRGAERWNDNISVEAKDFLTDLKPMSEESIKTILNRRLLQVDCEKKGWVLQGFPENKRQGELLAEMFLEPNRVFVFSCTHELSSSRMAKKKKSVMKRHLNQQKPGRVNEKGNFLIFPFGEKSVTKRFESFADNLQGILELYGPKVIFVDAAMKLAEVQSFIESSVMRPPIRRK